MHAVTGAYADPIFVEKLGADPVVYQLLEMNHFFSWGIPLFDAEYTPGLQDYILNGVPLEDFGNGHPDPNLTYVNQSSNEEYARSAILTSC